MAATAASLSQQSRLVKLVPLARFSGLGVLYWDGNALYASRGYQLLRTQVSGGPIRWENVANFRPAWWRALTSSSRLSARLVRDGFHALAVLSSGHLIGAVPGAIVSLAPGEKEFQISHRVLRGTRPLHFASTPDGRCFWGEYFNNAKREEVHIYASSDRGATWNIAYTFKAGEIRHVHNIVYDRFANCLWILTGDDGRECRILRASCDLRTVDVVLAGKQQVRAAALVPAPDGVYFATDTPFETNHVYRIDRRGNSSRVADLSSSAIYGCSVGRAFFFSTMVEPSPVNRDRHVRIFGSSDGNAWQDLLAWDKDRLPMAAFQYGNAFLPNGNNTCGVLALTTIAVSHADLETSLWRVTT